MVLWVFLSKTRAISRERTCVSSVVAVALEGALKIDTLATVTNAGTECALISVSAALIALPA